jgi:hypothetical protein
MKSDDELSKNTAGETAGYTESMRNTNDWKHFEQFMGWIGIIHYIVVIVTEGKTALY